MFRLWTRRILLPASMAALLMLSLAYWWLDNGPHELFGAAMFTLLAWHLTVNRRWFMRLGTGRYDLHRWAVTLVHAWLAILMTVLVCTSLLISRSLPGMPPLTDQVGIVELHWFSAYWVVLIVAVHAGSHWTRVMTTARTALGVSPSRIRTGMGRLAALLLLGFGAWSFAVLGVSTKLTLGYSIAFWDFTSSVTPFFAHWTAVMAGAAVLSHYAMVSIRAHRQTSRPATRDQI
ncbi:hypothetical protein [Ferranicluibacter rubi]|uniref:DUF4405 domain-containing protein n=1 Tax=Ferranicluibacter rubi TaxID=2715133 RepID=A0AA43ZH13_9HYPH|nr:hypothetical protein [Ferranicluibacter rubi]PYE30121.1 hypothetical protein C8J37_1249 [Rhizobium sp. PP-WC-1G-195]TCP76083.1 hypothetical protein C8J31_12915 [Rhizobium sp. PP-CC-2G-626]TCQ02990.1 hypothetical protein C8J34_11443 [Rhizobium sp. PP-F2F-G36]TCQ16191.1 hypothetical protein C8J33_11724 [Rhizobium sp. PP-CC-3G-465]NHT77728.1 hypothetical protein [Ferranicluibacter rubi]